MQPTNDIVKPAPETIAPQPQTVPAPPAVFEPPKEAIPAKPKALKNTAKKPIFTIVVSVILFAALCAVAFYAYSRSN
jgi:hypothetical protein